MSSSDGKKVQKDIRDLFVKDSPLRVPMATEAAASNTDNQTKMSHETTGTVSGTHDNSNTEWLASVMKRVSVSTTIDDLKSVCCDLIAKVAELSSQSSIINNKSDKAVHETQTIKDDLNRLTRYYDREIEDVKNEIMSNEEYVTKDDFEKMQVKVDDLEGRSRRNNLRICNIPEGKENGYDDPSMEKFADMVIRQSLGIELNADAIQRAHRVGPKKPEKKRDIIVYFLRYTDKERIRREAPKKDPHFDGERIYFNEDLSAMSMEKRKALGEEMRRRRRNGQRAWLTYDKLMFVDEEDGFVYEITAAFPFYYLTDPRKRFKARPQNRPHGRRETTSSPRPNFTPRSLDYTGTTLASSMSYTQLSPVPPAASSPVTLAARLPSAKTPCFSPSQPILTPAPPDKRKERTPPTPPENIPKHARAEMETI